MADISKIKVSNTTYTVKDSSARGSISSMQTKLDGIQAGAEVNVQSDWDVTDTTSDAYIKNKPSIPQGTVTSVGVQAGSGSHLSVSGSPITSSGTMTVSVASGYSIPSDTLQNAWSSKQESIPSMVFDPNDDWYGTDTYFVVYDDGVENEDAPRPNASIGGGWDPILYVYGTGFTVLNDGHQGEENSYKQYSFPQNSGTLATTRDIGLVLLDLRGYVPNE